VNAKEQEMVNVFARQAHATTRNAVITLNVVSQTSVNVKQAESVIVAILANVAVANNLLFSYLNIEKQTKKNKKLLLQ
jgi:hypothetical protein